ncbi:putative transcriptional regulator [Azospirillum lipoferum]|uniref:Anti-sigma factor n=1 Tax=Azospirillum lipoferum TaxID=193 RepID=A0A5A9GJE9_AZOLI|nr:MULTISPECIES: ChrR family anti-sigma-E factor [Azospirillum]KAA0594497.1 anti-sigma factor [Azospirillum lipoferum]MCP1613250.1 putative transcriptional regulator [Azospirillum lipoferum]MDW5531449.1 ChrR family anti-sigma-E factor [Azospirillum sp. NL1]
MTLPLHHPDDQLLIGYASGQERAGKSLLVATHLAYCPDCRQRVASYEALCGEWFEDLPCPDHGALDALLDHMDGLLAAALPTAETASLKPLDAGSIRAWPVPEPLRSWLPKAIDTPTDDGTWREISKGVWLSGWDRTLSGTTICLLRMASGAPVPAHRHTADELLLVLRGAFRDEYGSYALGDVAQYVADTDHHAFGASEEDCICLFLLDGELIFLDEDGKPLQPTRS